MHAIGRMVKVSSFPPHWLNHACNVNEWKSKFFLAPLEELGFHLIHPRKKLFIVTIICFSSACDLSWRIRAGIALFCHRQEIGPVW